MFATIYSSAGLALCCAILVLAIWRGGATEQSAAGAAALVWASTLIIHAYVHAYARWLLVIDIALLAVFAVLVWRSSKDWPLLGLACQGVVVAMDAWYLLDRSIPLAIYHVAQAAASLGLIGAIAYGVWQAAARKSRARAQN